MEKLIHTISIQFGVLECFLNLYDYKKEMTEQFLRNFNYTNTKFLVHLN